MTHSTAESDRSERRSTSAKRRAVLAALVLVPVATWLSGCAGISVDPRAELRRAYDDLRAFLDKHATTPAETESWNAIVDAIEAKMREALEEATSFQTNFDAGLEDPETTAATLRSLVDDHLERRRSLRRAMLDDQERLKRAVGQTRWDELVAILNRGATKLLNQTRAA